MFHSLITGLGLYLPFHKKIISTALELATRKWERRQKEQEEELEKAEKLEKQKKNERDRLAARHASRRRMQQQLQVQQQINALSSDVTVNSTNQIGAPPQEDPSDQNSSPERNNANQVTREGLPFEIYFSIYTSRKLISVCTFRKFLNQLLRTTARTAQK